MYMVEIEESSHYYDIDFVKRAYYMLKNGDELIALVRTENSQKDDFKHWFKTDYAIIHDFEIKDWEASKGNKLSEIKYIYINNSIISGWKQSKILQRSIGIMVTNI